LAIPANTALVADVVVGATLNDREAEVVAPRAAGGRPSHVRLSIISTASMKTSFALRARPLRDPKSSVAERGRIVIGHATGATGASSNSPPDSTDSVAWSLTSRTGCAGSRTAAMTAPTSATPAATRQPTAKPSKNA